MMSRAKNSQITIKYEIKYDMYTISPQKQEAQPPQRNSASATHMEGG